MAVLFSGTAFLLVPTLVLTPGNRKLLLHLRLTKRILRMKYYIDRLTEAESAADKREFTRGVMGTEKTNAGSFALGWIAGWLITRGNK
jgi:hypothetical protein